MVFTHFLTTSNPYWDDPPLAFCFAPSFLEFLESWTAGANHRKIGWTPIAFLGKWCTCFFPHQSINTGWLLTYPSEKYESQLEWLFPIYGKIKNVPNHQPEYQRFAFLFISSYINLKHQNCKELIQRKKQCWKPWCSKSNIGTPAAPAYVPFNLGKLSSYDYWLVKNISSSVGIINFPIYGEIIQMFQTTNQIRYPKFPWFNPKHLHLSKHPLSTSPNICAHHCTIKWLGWSPHKTYGFHQIPVDFPKREHFTQLAQQP
jgi:hypothetical protein